VYAVKEGKKQQTVAGNREFFNARQIETRRNLKEVSQSERK